MGAGLISEIGLLNGQYRMSLRQVQTYLQDRWQLSFSLGAISQSQGKLTEWLEPLYAQIGAAVRQSAVAHADETTHYHRTMRMWLWTLCSGPLMYFMSHYGRALYTTIFYTSEISVYDDAPLDDRDRVGRP